MRDGALAAQTGHMDQALACFTRATELDPQNPNAWSNLGTAYARAGRAAAAGAAFARAVALAPNHAMFCGQLGDACLQAGDYAQAVAHFLDAARLAPDDVRFRLALVNAHRLAGDPARALALLEETTATEGDSAQTHTMAGDLHVALGDFASAAHCYGAALAHDAGYVDALLGLSRLPAELAECNLRGRIEARLADPALPEDGRIGLSFALGNLLDQAAAPEQAIIQFQDANRRLRSRLPSDMAAKQDAAARIMDSFTAEQLRHGPTAGRAPRPLPVFIFGMPRSGTTLVERILAAHPHVHAGGELPYVQRLVQDWPDLMPDARRYPDGVADAGSEDWERLGQRYLAKIAALAPEAACVTDKNPFNFQQLGLISLIVPEAKLIHCVRDPMDVCASNFIAYYTGAQAVFSYDFESLAGFYRLYEQLMAHWRAVLQIPMHEISYERLIVDQEGESRRLFEFCGLPWDERAIDFHAQAGAVGTASDIQVRQPLHNRSVGRWQRYGTALAPLRELLDGR
jgi:tetratricopeptide (TPR) repeat protein